MADELSAPLVARRDRKAARRLPVLGSRRLPVARLAAAAILLVLGAAALRVLLVDDPGGGRPATEVDINSTRNANAIADQLSAPAVSGPTTSTPVAGGPSITVLGGDAASGAVAPPAADSAAAGSDGLGALPALSEVTDDGPLPRIAADGTTPFAAYARPTPPADGRPRVAIVVTGLGLSETGTLDAVAKLPSDVTLAFAPYGKTLAETVPAAHAKGHELLLEIPLEPFDYPANDPGPQTLLTGQPPRENLERLFWLMTRIGGYVGVINNMGARFTASAADFEPVMEELGTRGLGYLDDGSSNRSVASELAGANRVPFSRADMTVDDNPARAPILAALSDLEDMARQKGSAVGVASALPVTIDAIAEWAAGLKEEGVVLVPASALMRGAPK